MPGSAIGILVHSGGETDRVGKINAEDVLRCAARDPAKDQAQQAWRKEGKLPQGQMVRPLGIQPEEKRPENRGVMTHFPMQNVLKILPRISSISAAPTTSPAASRASRSGTATSSGSACF